MIVVVYTLIIANMVVISALELLKDWRTWLVLTGLSIAAQFALKLLQRPASSTDPLERQPHDPAPRHVDAREWT